MFCLKFTTRGVKKYFYIAARFLKLMMMHAYSKTIKVPQQTENVDNH